MAFKGVVPSAKKPVLVDYMQENGRWSFEEKMDPTKYVGFIYVIFDKFLKRAYLGKKQYKGTGKLNKGKELNWKKYQSSSKLVKKLFDNRPIDEFEFICIEQYKTKGTLSYSETWSLCKCEIPTSVVWYNTLINKVSWNVKEPISERHRRRLNEVLRRLNE